MSYNSKSKKEEEFICHEEIEETLRYAEEHKNDVEDMRKILERAKDCKGLSYREAALLLECEDESIHQEIFRLAEEIKEKFYGNRIVLFAPLYLSNYCINGCKYCPYHGQNKHISRKKLTQEQIRQEVTALQDMGHKRLAIEAGEDPKNNPIEYILECIDTIYSIKHKNGAIRRVNVNIAATTVENYKKLKDALRDRNWYDRDYLDENPTFIEGIKGKKYCTTQLWCDEKNNWYELALKNKEITITREDGPASSDEMVAEVDLDFLQNSPQENILDSESWLKQKGYHYTISGTEHYKNYDITNPQSADWNISYIGYPSRKSFSVVYNALEKDCTDLPALYESVKAKLEISGFTVVCQEAETAKNSDNSSGKFMIWQDASGNLYDLFLQNSSYDHQSEVGLIRERKTVYSSEAVSYDVKNPADQLNISALVAMPMNSYIGDENWKQKFQENYGSVNYQPDMSEGDSWCSAFFAYYPSDQENKKELLRYLKKEIQDATGKKMQLNYTNSYKNGFAYAYEVETKQNRIILISDWSAEEVGVMIESSRDK